MARTSFLSTARRALAYALLKHSIMKLTYGLSLILSLVLMVGSIARATDDDVFDGLVDQATKLSQQPLSKTPGLACRDRYAKMWAKGRLDIAWFYGYVDEDDVVADQRLMASQIRALTMKCHDGLRGACGFTIAQAPQNEFDPVILSRNLGTGAAPRSVRIRIWHSSLSQHDHENDFGVGKVIFKRGHQIRKTESVWQALESSLQDSQVLIYDGHSRFGTGPGFWSLRTWRMADRKITSPDIESIRKRFEKRDGRTFTYRPSRLANPANIITTTSIRLCLTRRLRSRN